MITKKEALLHRKEEQAPMSMNDDLIISPEALQAAQCLASDIASSYPLMGTVEDASFALSIPATTIRSLCRSGQLGAIKVGRLWRIPRSELLAFIHGGGCDVCDR